MTGLHDSTLALSVYNALARCGQLTREQILTVLKANWNEATEAEEIEIGIGFLARRNFIAESDGVLIPSHFERGTAATVIRNPLDNTELTFSRVERNGAKLDTH